MSRTHNLTRFCPEESSHLQSGQANAYAASSSINRSLASDNRQGKRLEKEDCSKLLET
ncbi:unnamed protein product [Arabidopsis halleri]